MRDRESQPAAAEKAPSTARSRARERGAELQAADRLGNRRMLELLRAGAGRPLPAATRRSFEMKLGADLGEVRLHDDAAAATAARARGAEAFTAGGDVALAGGLGPSPARAMALLGHELAHVVQQRSGRVGGDERDQARLEREADAAGAALAAGGRARVDGGSSGAGEAVAIQCQSAGGAHPTATIDDAQRWFHDAEVAFNAGRFEEAAGLFELLVGVPELPSSAHPTLIWNMASCYRRLGRIDRAIATFTLLIERPDTSAADRTQALAVIASLRNLQGASHAGPAAASTLAQGQAAYQQALAAFAARRYEETLAIAEQLLGNPSLPASAHDELLWAMAQCFRYLGQITRAIAMFTIYSERPDLSPEHRATALRILGRLRASSAP